MSILAGINDVVYYAENRDWLDNEIFEQNYRTILEEIKTKTNAKIMMIEPFLFPVEDKLYYREDLDPKIQIIRKLANQYADVFMPLDGPLISEYIGKDLDVFTPDGVHPFPPAAKIIAKWYAEYIEKLL
ncbi:MAG: hypothetical protein IKK71_01815 [Clostridia bacterium]|nr:hypothetical protein [Clostridia bacterium]